MRNRNGWGEKFSASDGDIRGLIGDVKPLTRMGYSSFLLLVVLMFFDWVLGFAKELCAG